MIKIAIIIAIAILLIALVILIIFLFKNVRYNRFRKKQLLENLTKEVINFGHKPYG